MLSRISYPLLRLAQRDLKRTKGFLHHVQLAQIQRKKAASQGNEQIEPNTELSEFVPVSCIKYYLHQKAIIFTEGFTCLSFDCPNCGVKEAIIFINKISGYFFCIQCKKSGSWDTLQDVLSHPEKFADIPEDASITAGKNKWIQVTKQIHPFSALSDAGKEQIIRDQIGFENLPLEKLNLLDVCVDLKTNYIYLPLKNNNEIVGYKIFMKGGEVHTFPQNSACGILSLKGSSKSAVIVTSVKDFLTLSIHDLDEDIVCLPHGEHQFPLAILPLMEHYEKLILWFGSSSASWDSARVFARKLCSSRCFLVRPLEDQSSAYNAHLSKANIPKIVSEASCIAHPSIITFDRLRDDIAAELHNADKVSGVKWKRFPSLNTILKGHRRGELTILTGPTGSGKTTFISEYSLDLAMQQVTTLWGSFEIRNQRLAKTMLQQMVLEPLEKHLNNFDTWADNFEQLPIYFMTFHGQQQLSTVMEAVQHATYVHDVSHVIIDNVQFMLGLSSKESGFLDRQDIYVCM